MSVGTGGVARFGHPRLDPSPDSFEELYGLTTVGLYAMIAQLITEKISRVSITSFSERPAYRTEAIKP